MSSNFCGIQTNFLQVSGFQLILPRFPKAQYFSTDFVLPSISLPAANIPTPFTDLKVAGDKPIFDTMQFTFMVSEDMGNYEEVQKWISNIGYATSYTDYTNYSNKDSHQPLGEQDAKVLILTNKGNALRTITFYDAIPIGLSALQFTTQSPDAEYIKATVSMAYTRFDLV